MAKIKYSALVQEMRNKLNGSVASRNRYGNYWRNKTTPVNPQTASQQNNRARLSSVSQAWRGLTPAQRASFAALATEHPFTDIFGDQHVYDGKAMFSKLNMNLLIAGESIMAAAQPFREQEFIPIQSATASLASGVDLVMDAVSGTPDTSFVVSATPPLSPTINFVKNRFRVIGAYDADTAAIDLTSDYNDVLGGLSSADAGRVIHFRVHVTDLQTGQTSIATELSTAVTA